MCSQSTYSVSNCFLGRGVFLNCRPSIFIANSWSKIRTDNSVSPDREPNHLKP